MEIEALESILMGDMRKLPDDSGDGIASIANCAQYQIEISAYGDNDSVPEDEDERAGDDSEAHAHGELVVDVADDRARGKLVWGEPHGRRR